jgi:hypothetical protein
MIYLQHEDGIIIKGPDVLSAVVPYEVGYVVYHPTNTKYRNLFKVGAVYSWKDAVEQKGWTEIEEEEVFLLTL